MKQLSKGFRKMAYGGDNDPFSGSSSASVSSTRKKKWNPDIKAAPQSFMGTALNLTPKKRFTGSTADPDLKKPGVSAIVDKILPYASNIANAFRRAPKPSAPILNAAQKLQKINMDDARYQVGREIGASNTGADRTLDSNTAMSVKLFNSGRKINELGKINEFEKNANAGISNQQAMLDYQNQVGNNAKLDEFNNTILEGKIADSANQSANFANAADKYIAIGNERAKGQLDLDKTKTLSTMFSTNGPGGGLFNRERLRIAKTGAVDPLLGRALTPMEIAQIGYTNDEPVVTSTPPAVQPTAVTPAPISSDRIPYMPPQAKGYPYSNTTLPKQFSVPANPLIRKSKFQLGGQMRKVKY